MTSRSQTPRILFVDDDPDIQTAARLLMARRGLAFTPARSPQEALAALSCEAIDVVLLDLNYAPGATTGAEGLALLRAIHAACPGLPVVVVTGHSGVAIAVSAMRAGAVDFVMKPWNNDRLIAVLHNALEHPNATSVLQSRETSSEIIMIGDHPAMRRAFETADRIATASVNVLLSGAPGTGKSALGRRIHRQSNDPAPLGTLHGAAFDAAPLQPPGGTWLLRDIETLDIQSQRTLLDRLERPDAPRILGTTRLEPHALQDRLGSTLFFRLATIQIALPALAARREDIPELAHHALRFYAHRHHRPVPELSGQMAEQLQAEPWPQNLHAFLPAMERAVLLGMQAALNTPGKTEPAADSTTLAQSERSMIEQALKRHGFNVSHAARELGLTRPALYRRMARYGF